MCKLWLIWLVHYWTYKTHNYYSTDIPNVFELFSISVRRNDVYETVVAKHNTSTNIYTFGNHRFLSLNEMLDYVLTC